MKAVILAGGLGTRLKGVLGELPKPMAPIGEKPFLEYPLMLLKAQGLDEFILCIGHGGGKIRDHFGDGARFGVSIRYTVESRPLGTGGAIKLVEPLIGTDVFFVLNGDTYFEADPQAMLQFHRSIDATATLALARRKDTGRYGAVALDEKGRIVSFDEKDPAGKGGYINGGMYIFGGSIFDRLPADRACSLEREILPALIGREMYGFPADGYFIDIGIPEDYEKARKELPSRGAP